MEKHDDSLILGIYLKSDEKEWNKFLFACLAYRDMTKLLTVRKELQKDMANLAKRKMNFDKVNTLFLRLTRSIEKSAKQLWNEAYLKPDMPISQKRILDNQFEDLLKKESY